MSTVRTLLAFLVLLMLAIAPMARAGDDPAAEARKRFGEATEALKANRFREAGLHFEAAARLRPHPSAYFYAGVAWDKAEEPARAADNFYRALKMPNLGSKDQKAATERLTSLSASLGSADITGSSEVMVQFENSTEAAPPVRLHATPGARSLMIVQDGKIIRHDVFLKQGETINVDVDEAIAAAAAPSTSAAPPPPPPPASTSAEPAPPPPPSDPAKTRKIIGYTAIGAGVVTAGIAVVLGLKTMSARDDYESAPTRDGYDNATSLRTWTNVAWVGAIVLGGAGTALVLWPSKKDPDSNEEGTSVSLSPTMGGLQLGGKF